MNIIELKQKTDVTETLDKAKELYKDFTGVMIIAVDREGLPSIMTSSISGYQKTWMLTAATAQLYSSFGFKRS